MKRIAINLPAETLRERAKFTPIIPAPFEGKYYVSPSALRLVGMDRNPPLQIIHASRDLLKPGVFFVR